MNEAIHAPVTARPPAALARVAIRADAFRALFITLC